MTTQNESAYGPKLYARLFERWHSMDHCQSSPILIHGMLEEVKDWLESKLQDPMFIYDDDWIRGYNDAIEDLIQDL